jgi:hypothetical protein
MSASLHASSGPPLAGPLLRVAVAVAALGACRGDEPGVEDGGPARDGPVADAGPRGPCWPVEGSTPRGSVVLGTGSEFSPMPDELALVFGQQGGFHVEVHARMDGLVAGNRADIFDPINPRTRFRVFFVDTGEPIDPSVCPIRLAYEPVDGGGFDLVHGHAVQFSTSLGPEEVFGRDVRVVVEVLDSTGGYATDEKVITCVEPSGWADAGPPS